tara:strand:- start:7 stop:495 length:489 start_codon:yes stop_codon:yes gene_type:complete
MPTPTYTLIDSVTLASSASSVTFSGISGTGKGDLVLQMEHSAVSGTLVAQGIFNSDSGSNYNTVLMNGNGSSAATGAGNNVWFNFGVSTSTAKIISRIQIQDFSAIDKHKSCLARLDRADYQVYASALRWASTSAITSIGITASASSFAAGSTFHLYQIVSE